MKVALAISSRLPALKYGGSERAFFWLAKALERRGVEVTIVCGHWDLSAPVDYQPKKILPWNQSADDWRELGRQVDLVHFMGTPQENFSRDIPYLCTIQGNGKVGDEFPANCVFVSRNHAERHSWTEFVHNGVALDEYPLFDGTRSEALLFLAKARWRVKNLRGTLEIAKAVGRRCSVIGGKRPLTLWGLMARHADFAGEIGGAEKLRIIQQSAALLFPVIWEEPFGIAVIEALACGTPAIVCNRGSMPEIVDDTCGRLCTTFQDYVKAVRDLKLFNDPATCRKRVADNFTDDHMAAKYLDYYKTIAAKNRLRDGRPHTIADQPRETPGFGKMRKLSS